MLFKAEEYFMQISTVIQEPRVRGCNSGKFWFGNVGQNPFLGTSLYLTYALGQPRWEYTIHGPITRQIKCV